MRAAYRTLLAVALVAAVGAVAVAQKGKEVTLKGELGCPKCVFKLDKKVTGGKCGTAIQVTEKKDGKEVKTVYVVLDKGAKEKYHGKICMEKKTGSVTGTVSKKGDQMYITPAKDGVKIE